LEDFPIYKDEDRLSYLAYFFERLARHLLHLEPISPDRWFSERGSHHYDIDADALNAYVEVKGSGNSDQLKLFTDQLDFQLGELGFPVNDGFIWIFSYRNRDSRKAVGGQKRLLKYKSGKSWKSFSAFLAEHINVAYIIDVRLLDLLRKQNGLSSYTRDAFNLRHVIRLNRTNLKDLAENARENLLKLGVSHDDLSQWLPPNAKRFRPRTVETTFDGRAISFQLIILTPNGFKNRFLRRLNGTVKRNKNP